MDSCFAPIGSHQHGIAWIQISPRLEWHSCQAYERTNRVSCAHVLGTGSCTGQGRLRPGVCVRVSLAIKPSSSTAKMSLYARQLNLLTPQNQAPVDQ